LGLFLVINVRMTIVPIREISWIRTQLLSRGSILLRLSMLFFLRSDLERLEWCLISGWSFHSMRVDNLVFFFRIKRLLLRNYKSFLILLMELFFVVRNHTLRVGILDESICASSSPIAWCTSSYKLKAWENTILWETTCECFERYIS